MAIKKISQFTSATPTAGDQILIEQNEAGRSATIGSLFSAGTHLLWQSSTGNFEPQTISLDLSPYRFVDIVCSFTQSTDDTRFMRRFSIGSSSQLEFTKFNYDTATEVVKALNGCYRDITITATGITFGNGNMFYDGNTYRDWPNRCIPLKIYGGL